MPLSRATSQQSAVPPAQQDALDALLSLKIPKREAVDLLGRAQGADTGELVRNALRMRGGASQRLPSAQAQGAMPVTSVPPPSEPRGAILAAPQAQPSQSQQQIPGFGPPGGPAAAPNAQQLGASVPPPGQGDYNPNVFWRLMGAPAPSPAAQRPPSTPSPPAEQGGYNPNAFWRLMGAPRPAPVGQGPLPAQGPTASPQMTPGGLPPAPIARRAPMQSTTGPMPAPIGQRPLPAAPGAPGSQMMATGPQSASNPEAQAGWPSGLMPAPIKPRIRVKAGGRYEAPAEAPKSQEHPMVATQQEYDRLPIGARFRHPDGYVYRKEKHSHEVTDEPQKMADGGVVQPDQGVTEPPQPPQPPQPPGNTDTVPAMLTPGEYVMSKPAVDQLGAQHMQELEQLLATERMMGQSPGQSQSGTTTQSGQPSGDGGKPLDKEQSDALEKAGLNVTRFGYHDDPNGDSESLAGHGKYNQNMVGGVSVALNQAAVDKLKAQGINVEPGKPFVYNGRTYQYDDKVPELYKDARFDIYSPGGQGALGQTPGAPPQGTEPTGTADYFRKRGDQPITASDDPRLTDVNVGKQNWKVNTEAAPYFSGFLSELAEAGAPVTSAGGWNYRQKVGAKGISEHAFGGAIDVNQTGRDEVTPEFKKWIAANPGVLQQLEQKWHIYGGERFGDLGHFEWGGVT
jgi:hypothetical protein